MTGSHSWGTAGVMPVTTAAARLLWTATLSRVQLRIISRTVTIITNPDLWLFKNQSPFLKDSVKVISLSLLESAGSPPLSSVGWQDNVLFLKGK